MLIEEDKSQDWTKHNSVWMQMQLKNGLPSAQTQ
jgi:hypothetical protein